MQAHRLEIPDVVVLEPRVFGDDRGFFYESFSERSFREAVGIDVRFVQDNHSRSARGVLRGLHYQLAPSAQGKLVRVVRGAVFDVAVDLRRGSPTFGRWVGAELSDSNRRQLWIPEGFAHGFLALQDGTEVLYKATAFYDPARERGIRWNDATLAIEWPDVGEVAVSAKDAAAPGFVQAEPVACVPRHRMASSVVIITYQTEPGEVDAYAGLAAQRTPPDEVVVLDNDGPCAAPAPPAGARQLPPPGRNLGFAAGCNRAAAATQGDWIVFLNPDARPAPGWLEALHRAQHADPGVAAIGSLQKMDGADGRLDGVGDAYHLSGLCWRQGYGKVLAPDRVAREASRAFAACAAAAAYRRDAFMALGGFDEDFFCYCEDVDLSFRLRLRGLDVAIACDAVVTHRGSVSSGGRRSDFALYHGHRNMVWVFVKNVPGWLFWALLPLHVMANLATIARFAVQGRGGVILRAKRDAIRGLPRMWAKRRQIQRERTVSAWSILRRMRWSLVR